MYYARLPFYHTREKYEFQYIFLNKMVEQSIRLISRFESGRIGIGEARDISAADSRIRTFNGCVQW